MDSGVDLSHPALSSLLWRNGGEVAANGIDDDGNGFIDDIHGADLVDGDSRPDDATGHGTHVAGLIGRRWSGRRPAGATGAAIMAVRILDEDGTGNVAALVSGIDYAVKNGADVINLSLSNYPGDGRIVEALTRAGHSGALVVCAAGNRRANLDHDPVYPASFRLPGMLNVAAGAAGKRLTSWSAYGQRTVDLAAPGVRLRSTAPRGRDGLRSGTSQAAARVSRAAAELRRVAPGASPETLQRALLGSTRWHHSLDGRVSTAGFLDTDAAVELLRSIPGS